VYAAHLARAELAEAVGDATTAESHRQKARALRRRFNEDFWLDGCGRYALGLDADGRPIDALTSNVGHCLWTGIIDPERAALVADSLMSSELFSGWGIRTLGTSMTGFNPVSYHNGSVWPHDTAIAIAGLTRYGFVDEAHRLIEAQLALAGAMQGRLPELVAGFPRGDPASPAPYPASCSPQAWASAATLLWLRSLLRLDPWAPGDRLWLHPELPSWMRHLRIDGLSVAGRRLTVDVRDDVVEISGADGGLDLRNEPRPEVR
jgi:glycogen debranching enzyme